MRAERREAPCRKLATEGRSVLTWSVLPSLIVTEPLPASSGNVTSRWYIAGQWAFPLRAQEAHPGRGLICGPGIFSYANLSGDLRSS